MNPILQAASSLRKLEENLYAFEFRGDYGLDAFLQNGGAKSDAEVAAYFTAYLQKNMQMTGKTEMKTQPFGCSVMLAKDQNGTVRFGRNYDWHSCMTMIMHAVPENGYESIGTCCMEFLGFGDGLTPEAGPEAAVRALGSLFVVLDGVNEKGLTVADLLAGDNEQTTQNTGKTAITTTTAIRLLLDRAADVPEAVKLLQSHDMYSSIGRAHHLAIADAKGNCAVAEYIDNQLYITPTEIITNHYMADHPKRGTGREESHARFNTLDALRKEHPLLDADGLKNAMKKASMLNFREAFQSTSRTAWTCICNLTEPEVTFCFNENFDSSYRLLFGKKDGNWIERI